MWTWGERVGEAGFWTAICLLFVVPLLWIFVVSLQPSDAVTGGEYLLIPNEWNWEVYGEILFQDTGGIRTALLYSLLITTISTSVAMIVSLSAVYVIIAKVLSPTWRRITVQGAVGLYFLPAFTVYPGIQFMAWLPPFKGTLFQLVVVQSVLGFVISFILLLLAYSSVPHSYFEQLLLETRSRLTAFWRGVVSFQTAATMVVTTVTFALVWNEFFISLLITAAEPVKPFSVKLQMAQQQYTTDYSTFAAGAILSLLISFLFPLIVVGIVVGAFALAARRSRIKSLLRRMACLKVGR